MFSPYRWWQEIGSEKVVISSSTTTMVGGGSGQLVGEAGAVWQKVGGGVLLLSPSNQGFVEGAAKLVCEASNEAGRAMMEVCVCSFFFFCVNMIPYQINIFAVRDE